MKSLTFLILGLGFLGCANLRDPSLKEILDNAQHDMEVDSVKYFTAGLPFIKPVLAKEVTDKMSDESLKSIHRRDIILDSIQIKQKLRKNIYNKYGLYERNLGCMIDKQTSILSKEYKKITSPYLEKRNGKDWRIKMEKELNSTTEN
ncbi:hypothetical protein [Flavobacterium sp.]|uniref:FEKKY domain-containing protein n=1 Tax=Flavobacterium sp. TaxID=239 RepID=UPI0025BC2BD9|nr:hypothetical protein [Flavobacterium sp.]